MMDNIEYLEPETIRMLRGEETTSLEVLKAMTEKIIRYTVAPFVDFYVFENVVHVLNNIEPDVDKIEGCTPEQIWLALEICKDILGEYPDLDEEVETYIRFTFRNYGYAFLPPYFGKQEGFSEIVKRSEGPYPIIVGKNPIEQQAVNYLRIMEYLNANRSV